MNDNGEYRQRAYCLMPQKELLGFKLLEGLTKCSS